MVVLATAGSTNSVRTISAHLLTYSEQPSGVVILERRYGPRRLRDDDDDDDEPLFPVLVRVSRPRQFQDGSSRLAAIYPRQAE